MKEWLAHMLVVTGSGYKEACIIRLARCSLKAFTSAETSSKM